MDKIKEAVERLKLYQDKREISEFGDAVRTLLSLAADYLAIADSEVVIKIDELCEILLDKKNCLGISRTQATSIAAIIQLEQILRLQKNWGVEKIHNLLYPLFERDTEGYNPKQPKTWRWEWVLKFTDDGLRGLAQSIYDELMGVGDVKEFDRRNES